MKVLVTGATGFLGSRTIEYLSSQPAVSSILATGRNSSFRPAFSFSKVRYQFGGLSDRMFVDRLFDDPIDYVVNCASLSSPWGSFGNFYRCNVLTQQHLIQASQTKRIKRFIYISSPSIYFDFEDHVQLTEEHPIPEHQVNHYAETKLKAERLLASSGLEYAILRPRGLIGRGDTVIVPRLVRSCEEGRLRMVGSGQNEVDFTAVANMAEAIWLAMGTASANCQTAYNISNGEPVRLWSAINDILTQLGLEPVKRRIPYIMLMAIARMLEWRATYLNKGREPALTRYSAAVLARTFTCDISKVRQKLGFIPKQSLAEATQEFVSWYREQHQKR